MCDARPVRSVSAMPICTPTGMCRAAVVAGSLAAMATVAGCGSSPADKTGATARKSATKVLTLATADSGTRDLGSFIGAVEKVSGGKLSIRVRSDMHPDDPDAERRLIDDARAGRFDLVKVGARAWDLAGVRSFAPLVAP